MIYPPTPQNAFRETLAQTIFFIAFSVWFTFHVSAHPDPADPWIRRGVYVVTVISGLHTWYWYRRMKREERNGQGKAPSGEA